MNKVIRPEVWLLHKWQKKYKARFGESYCTMQDVRYTDRPWFPQIIEDMQRRIRENDPQIHEPPPILPPLDEHD